MTSLLPSREAPQQVPIMVKSFTPLPSTLALSVPSTASVGCILGHITQQLSLPSKTSQLLRLTRLGGQAIERSTNVSALAGPPNRNQLGYNVIAPLILEVRMAIRGGKGGFGNMLRAQGGKMSSNRNGEENNDSCRDLNGRRLSTVKQARQLALYLSTQVEREKELSEAQKKKYAKLEKMLGRKPKGESDFVEAAQKLHEQGGSFDEDAEEGDDNDNRGEGSSSSASLTKSSTTKNSTLNTEYKGKKRNRIEDSEYLEQSREIVDNVRSAVALAMKKKKKQKVASNGNAKSTTPVTQTV